MNTKATYIVQYILRIFLMSFWLYVALDKVWDLEAFHRALLRQPFPHHWADILYWSLPVTEAAIALLLIFHPTKQLAFLCSAILLLVFSFYISLGIAGLYTQRPCGCASVFHGLTWEWHLLVNLALFSLSILGWYLTGPTAPMDYHRMRHRRSTQVSGTFTMLVAVPVYPLLMGHIKRFAMRFAVFPGRPVSVQIMIREDALRQNSIPRDPGDRYPSLKQTIDPKYVFRVFWRTFFAIIKTATRDENYIFHQK